MNPLFLAGTQAVKHSVMRTISVICVLLVAAGLWFAVDKAFIHPRKQESYAQKAETIQNIEYNYNECDKKFFLGVKILGFRLGLSK